MNVNKKKAILTTIGGVLVFAGIIWGKIGFQVRHAPILFIIIIAGCVFAYIGMKVKE